MCTFPEGEETNKISNTELFRNTHIVILKVSASQIKNEHIPQNPGTKNAGI
jgi:hypothetical protein